MKPATIKFNDVTYKVWIEEVTPEKARALIDSNGDRNRKLRSGRVARYAADMTAGKWRITGEPIRLDEHSRLLNGQHRLEGVCVAGCTVPMLFISGIAAETMLVQDTGLPTSAEDWMPIEHGAAVTKIVRSVIRVFAPGLNSTVSRDEILAVYRLLGEEHVNFAIEHCNNNGIGRKAAVRAALAIIHRLDPKRAALFARRISDHDLPGGSTESALDRALTATHRHRTHDIACSLAMRAVVAAVRDKDQHVTKMYEIGDRDLAWLVKEAGLEGIRTLRQAA